MRAGASGETGGLTAVTRTTDESARTRALLISRNWNSPDGHPRGDGYPCKGLARSERKEQQLGTTRRGLTGNHAAQRKPDKSKEHLLRE